MTYLNAFGTEFMLASRNLNKFNATNKSVDGRDCKAPTYL